MNNRLAPSKSTVYLSNIPYDLKNNDIHKLFEKHGKIVKVTIVKDKVTRKSKGVAFIMYLLSEDAQKCVEATNMKEMYGRTLKASIAQDNGRSAEFIKKKLYPDKSTCYECGEEGHLSYSCSKNLLGVREPPPKKKRKRKAKPVKPSTEEDNEEQDSDNIPDDETLSAAIKAEQAKQDLEDYRFRVATGNYSINEANSSGPKKKFKKSSYFSDEEESD